MVAPCRLLPSMLLLLQSTSHIGNFAISSKLYSSIFEVLHHDRFRSSKSVSLQFELLEKVIPHFISPHQCRFCERSFSRKFDWSRHEKTHSDTTKVRRYGYTSNWDRVENDYRTHPFYHNVEQFMKDSLFHCPFDKCGTRPTSDKFIFK